MSVFKGSSEEDRWEWLSQVDEEYLRTCFFKKNKNSERAQMDTEVIKV